MNKVRGISSFLSLISMCLLLFVVDTKCKRGEFEELRRKELISQTSGEITGITKARKSNMLIYSYSFRINNHKYKSIYTMVKKYEGITVGSPVGVIYLNKDPNKSRIVFTDEDFNWIE